MLTTIPNCTIYYNTSDPTPTGFDPVTNKPIFSVTEQSITASLEENEIDATPALEVGVNELVLHLYGRLISPTTLPTEIVPRGYYRLEYQLPNDRLLTGKFYFDLLIPDRLQLDLFFGTPIQGWFVY